MSISPPPPETPILQSARFTAALWYQNLCFPHCACTAYGMRRKRRNPRQTPSSHTAASIVEPCFGSAVHEKQRNLFRVPINSATIANPRELQNPPPPPPPPPRFQNLQTKAAFCRVSFASGAFMSSYRRRSLQAAVSSWRLSRRCASPATPPAPFVTPRRKTASFSRQIAASAPQP